jgi:hypothetical protein
VATRAIVAASVLATVGGSCAVAWMKLRGLWPGDLLLAYVFLPCSLFLIADALRSIYRDRRYLFSRWVRLVIATVFLAIHVDILWLRH